MGTNNDLVRYTLLSSVILEQRLRTCELRRQAELDELREQYEMQRRERPLPPSVCTAADTSPTNSGEQPKFELGWPPPPRKSSKSPPDVHGRVNRTSPSGNVGRKQQFFQCEDLSTNCGKDERMTLEILEEIGECYFKHTVQF